MARPIAGRLVLVAALVAGCTGGVAPDPPLAEPSTPEAASPSTAVAEASVVVREGDVAHVRIRVAADTPVGD